ncbi:hypothetical protein [Flavobacterium aquicola]|uniref:Uncharacterized protein n=1 Tax=Flavobacterium aquicola TaxID=1682742 RepID=A0A3E0DWI7_9FLAO|nr:hypothetical protein [Flavobacterium aquicola]REG90442.1 hypothetical protein C8P67_1259 [Flavobacterium aquicola]
MRKILKITGIYLLLIILDFSCAPPEHVLINGIEFNSATIKDRKDQREFNNYVETSVFKNDIVFIISENLETVASLNLRLTEKCYATTFAKTYDNSILEESFSLKLNKDFTYGNVLISANQNLFEIPEIRNQISIFQTNQSFGDKIIEFSHSFINDAIFSNEVYQVEFECKTTDNRLFNKVIEVKFEN